MSSYVLSLLLAVIACVIGGALGGMILARPAALLEAVGLADDDTPKPSLFAEGRALGGMLITPFSTGDGGAGVVVLVGPCSVLLEQPAVSPPAPASAAPAPTIATALAAFDRGIDNPSLRLSGRPPQPAAGRP